MMLRFTGLALSGVLACGLPPPEPQPTSAGELPIMRNVQAELLKRKLELDAVSLPEPTQGIVLDWNTALVQGFLADETWKLSGETTLSMGPGEAMHKWIWERRSGWLTVAVFVSSDGPLLARQRLVKLATENQLPNVPYVRGPDDLGDISTIFAGPPGFTHLIWAYKHVCVSLKTQEARGVDVTRIARAVQTHLASQALVRLDEAAPQIEHVELSATRVRVKERLTIQIRMREADAQKQLLVDLKGRDQSLRLAGGPSLTTTLSVDVPGPRTLTMIVADQSTLLSAWTTVSFDVTPAADARSGPRG